MAVAVATAGTVPSVDRESGLSIAPYVHEAYDSLPSLRFAAELFQQLDAKAVVTGPIRDLFLKHNAHKTLGIALLHKHFPIKPTDRLVDCRNISAAWDMGYETLPVTRKYDSPILPRSFRFIQGRLVPYEFEVADAEMPIQMDDAFLAELSALLSLHNLDQVLGLRILDKQNPELTVEVTEGNMNIMIRRGVVPENELIQALWVFSKAQDEACHCKEFCRRDRNGDHFESNHSCG